MVTDDPVSVGCGSTGLRVGCGDLSAQVVVKALEQTLTEVHVTDRVDTLGEVNATGNLAVPVSPVMLNALHVPLVDNDDHFLATGPVNLSKEVRVALIDHDLFDSGEEGVCRLNEPVHV